MKFLKIILISLWLVLSSSLFAEYIKSPEGRSVYVYPREDPLQSVLDEWNETTDNFISLYELNAVRIGTSTLTYNCHYYAWVKSENRGNAYWMNSAPKNQFITDALWANDLVRSYIPATEAEATHTAYEDEDHSARKIQNSYPAVIVSGRDYVSKWGGLGLVKHQKNHDIYYQTYSYDHDFRILKTEHSGTYASNSKVWVGAGNMTHTLTDDVAVGWNKTLTVKSGTFIDVDEYFLYEYNGTITFESNVTYNAPVALYSSSTSYTGLFNLFSQPVSIATSGQTIEINGNIVLDQNETLPAGVTLVINSGYFDLDGNTLTMGEGAEVVSDICVKNGASIEGYYALVSDAMTRCASGEVVEVEGTHTIDDYYFQVPSGKTLKCLSGSELILRNNYWYLTIIGTLIAENTTFRTSSGTWGGVYYAGSSGSLTNCEIYDAVLGVYCNNSSPTIDNCEIYDCMVKGIALVDANPTIEDCNIHDCEYGIYCDDDSNPTISSVTLTDNEYGIYCDDSDPTIEYCKIEGDVSVTSYGIYCYGSDPEIEGDTIAADYGIYATNGSSPELRDNIINKSVSEKGLYCYSNSSPILADVQNGDGNNSFSGNFVSIAVHAVSSSYPVLGFTTCSPEEYGNNSFDYGMVDDYLVRAESNSVVSAEHCWWGSSSPSSSLFYGTVDYTPWLTSAPSSLAPNPEGNLFDQRFMLASAVPDGNEEVSEDLTQYYNDQWDLDTKMSFLRYLISLGEAEGIADLCKDIIFENPYAPEAFAALDMIYQISKNEKIKKDIDKEMFKTYLKTFEDNKSNKFLEANAMLLLAGLEKDVKRMDKVYKEHKNTYMGKYALHHQFMYYIHEEEDNMDLAREILNEMDEVYPDEEVTYEAHLRMGDDVGNNGEEDEAQLVSTDIAEILPKEYVLSAAYPNPFNPQTTLEYALPVQSKVECCVFDLSGNLVKEFSYNQNAGTHTITWDGSNVSSGIYLIRFVAEAQDGSNSFVDYQKVTLLK